MKLRLIALFVSLALAISALVGVAVAAQSSRVEVPTGTEHVGALVAASEQVVINGTVRGDVIVAGSDVTINGDVHGSVYAAGQTIKINGPVDGGIHAAGSTVEIRNTVGGSLFIAGSKVSTSREAEVRGAVFAAGSDLSLAGNLQDNLYAAGSSVTIEGRVGRDVALAGSQLKLSDEARISGNLKYASDTDLKLPNDDVVSGSVVRSEQRQPTASERFRQRTFDALYWLLANIILAAIAWRLFPQVLRRSVTTFVSNPGTYIGRGLAVFFFVPVVLILGLITVIGIPVVLIGALGYLLAILLAHLFAANFIGGLIWSRTQPKSKPTNHYWQELGATSMGILAIAIVTLVPVFGELIASLVGLLGIALLVGALWPTAQVAKPKRVAS